MYNLDAILSSRGMTKKDLADRLGITKQGLNSMKNPTLSNLEKVANALEIPLWMLFREEQVDNLDGAIITINGVKYRLTRME